MFSYVLSINLLYTQMRLEHLLSTFMTPFAIHSITIALSLSFSALNFITSKMRCARFVRLIRSFGSIKKAFYQFAMRCILPYYIIYVLLFCVFLFPFIFNSFTLHFNNIKQSSHCTQSLLMGDLLIFFFLPSSFFLCSTIGF